MFKPTVSLSKARKTSFAWLERQYNDPYVKQRLSDPRAYRSRSAFKLLEMDDQWDDFLSKPDVKVVVDLGAAPGGWSQVVAGKLGWNPGPPNPEPTVPSMREDLTYRRTDIGWSVPRPSQNNAEHKFGVLNTYDPLNIDALEDDNDCEGRGTIVAVDLLRMKPIQGVHFIQADFLSHEADKLIHGLLSVAGNPEGRVDIILSDMAANMSGNHIADTESSLKICEAVLKFAKRHLRTAEEIGRTRGGVLLLKHFHDPLLHKFRMRELEPLFHTVKFVKPDSSRSESSEGYFLCQGWMGNKNPDWKGTKNRWRESKTAGKESKNRRWGGINNPPLEGNQKIDP